MSTCKQRGYPSRVLASAPLSGNKTKQITGRAFSSCCHFVVFPTLFFCLLCSCTLRQKWNYAKTREVECPGCTQHGLACRGPTHSTSVASDGYEPEMAKFRLWMYRASAWDLCWGSNRLQKPPCFETEYFLFIFVLLCREKKDPFRPYRVSWRTTHSGRD